MCTVFVLPLILIVLPNGLTGPVLTSSFDIVMQSYDCSFDSTVLSLHFIY